MPLKDIDKPEVASLSVAELHRLYDHLCRNWHGLKTRTLGLLAGEVAIVSFLFTGDDKFTHQHAAADKIFFGTGIALISVAFGLLLVVLATSSWKIPFDTKMSRDAYRKNNSKLEYLEAIKEDYENCIDFCLGKFGLRAKIYNYSLIMLSVGIIILLVLKFN